MKILLAVIALYILVRYCSSPSEEEISKDIYLCSDHMGIEKREYLKSSNTVLILCRDGTAKWRR